MRYLEILNKTSGRYDKKLLNIVFSRALKELKYKEDINLSLVFVSDKEIKRLNKKYRRENKVTDVLSFKLMPLSFRQFILPKRLVKIISGEIIISYPQAKRQAKIRGHSIKKEMAILLTHGILHLFGFDHKTKKEEIIMRKLEERILSEIKIK